MRIKPAPRLHDTLSPRTLTTRGWGCLPEPPAPLPFPNVFGRDTKPEDRRGDTKRGEFRADSTRIDLHRLWMHRFDESLPRIMRITPSGKRSLILFATDPDQPVMQVSGIETSQHQIAMFGLDWPYYLRSSAACGWGTISLTPEDLAAASEAIIGRPVTP